MNHHWTPEDFELMRQRTAQGWKADQIAAEIGTTTTCVHQLRSRLKINQGDNCRYCDADLQHTGRGRRKTYCDTLCQHTHRSELEMAARRAPYADGQRRCEVCDAELGPFRQKHCSPRCGKSAWHQRVMADPKAKRRRYAMLKANKRKRAAR